MTRIVILADIHGNLPAFEAVQADIQRLAPDRVIVNGDILNRGPQSLECLHAVRATGWPVVYGNHEDYAVKRRAGGFPAEWAAPFFDPFQEVADALSDEEAAYLRALPRSMVLDVPGLPAFYVVHGSPRALNDGLGPWLSDEELRERLEMVPQPVMIGAHTHRPFNRRVGDRWGLNCSAVGMPYNGDPRAQYLVLTGRGGRWQGEFRAVPYDRSLVFAAYEANGALKHVINHVFKYELETATFHYGSYLEFCAQHDLERDCLASFERYRIAAADVEPGRSLKPSPPHPDGEDDDAGTGERGMHGTR